MRPRIVIIGATGFIGHAICEYFSQKEVTVVAVCRCAPSAPIGGLEYLVVGDFTHYEYWADLFAGSYAVVMAAGLAPDKKGLEPAENIFAVNVELPNKVASIALDEGVKVHIF